MAKTCKSRFYFPILRLQILKSKSNIKIFCYGKENEKDIYEV